ncbi:hypothetical protein M9H77_28393 [Catharanthus roseus]|uniref:Uncharacterized protein n=1 Tax=Catharanthus roseus TaxID=4058 RepID=A0ACC0AH55_CATRO|nr:hypothetical protein M9H77_28393 [Catharanthus roseus]
MPAAWVGHPGRFLVTRARPFGWLFLLMASPWFILVFCHNCLSAGEFREIAVRKEKRERNRGRSVAGDSSRLRLLSEGYNPDYHPFLSPSPRRSYAATRRLRFSPSEPIISSTPSMSADDHATFKSPFTSISDPSISLNQSLLFCAPSTPPSTKASDIPVHAKESTRENNHELDNGEVHQRSSVSGIATSSPIPLPAQPTGVTSGTELYYSSARSLSMSHTPPAGSLVVHRTSETDASPSTVPLLGSVSPIEYSTSPKIKATLCMVSFVTFCLSSLDLQKSESGRVEKIFQAPSGVMNQLGRRLLQTSMVSVRNSSSRSSNTIGTFLGWGMAAVYIGGRFPQILRNIRRGNAEGLNPLMFFFAVIGNITYMSSILVSSLEWSKIRANLPWLVDAVGCGLLDIFVS